MVDKKIESATFILDSKHRFCPECHDRFTTLQKWCNTCDKLVEAKVVSLEEFLKDLGVEFPW
jgi:transcriptional regulator NrdR family protein